MFEYKFASVDFAETKLIQENAAQQIKQPLLPPEIEGKIINFVLEPKLNNPAIIAKAQEIDAATQR